MTQVTVVDYGAGNLLSVVRALSHVGAEVRVTQRAEDIAAADRLVLPGVGAFADCMQALRQLSLVEPLRAYLMADRPYLGICVGMQVLFEVGEEYGEHEGLGIMAGRVVRIPPQDGRGQSLKIPHIGWSPLCPARGQDWAETPLAPLAGDMPRDVYFVHSYMAQPSHGDDCLAEVQYHGLSICAAVRRGQVYGVQFHPEKSGASGLSILKNFIAGVP